MSDMVGTAIDPDCFAALKRGMRDIEATAAA
jgi:hypothetical protein